MKVNDTVPSPFAAMFVMSFDWFFTSLSKTSTIDIHTLDELTVVAPLFL